INMPAINIDRAIKKGTGELKGMRLEETTYEIFGPGGSAIDATGITDSVNRTSNEIKHLLSQHSLSLASPGSTTWVMKNPVELSEPDKENLKKIVEELQNHDDIQEVRTNSNIGN
ncbi:YebC/PmpR family DNA-binding transcriptional regulator, partial [Patescibacteria group bacterium]